MKRLMFERPQLIALCLLVASIVLFGCGLGQSVSPTTAPVPVFTAIPTSTPLPTSTVIPSPAPLDGPQLTGTMVWLTKGTPMVGAWILLCKMSGDTCQTDAALATTTQAKGAFEFQTLDAGTYVILYNSSGPSSQAVGISLDLSDSALKCLAQGMIGSASASCQGTIPVFGDGSISLAKGTMLNVSASGVALKDGSLVSAKYGVNLDFADGKPVSVEIQSGKASKTDFKAWDK